MLGGIIQYPLQQAKGACVGHIPIRLSEYTVILFIPHTPFRADARDTCTFLRLFKVLAARRATKNTMNPIGLTEKVDIFAPVFCGDNEVEGVRKIFDTHVLKVVAYLASGTL